MTRTMRQPEGSQPAKLSRVTPAAMETTIGLAPDLPIEAHTSCACWGFVAMNTTSAEVATSVFSSVTFILRSAAKVSRHGL